MPITESANTAPSPKRKKTAIVVSVVAAIVVVAGAGFFVWHEQPSFCNAICHTPMDPYLPTYEAELGSPATDKWGNEVSDASGMLAAVHRAEGKNCLDCHVPTISEQVTEGIGWVSGSYYAPLWERSTTELVAARGLEDPDQFCLNESCHNMTREELVASTEDLEFNPHVEQHGTTECSDCHKAHRASVLVCSQCHDEAEIPAGWLSYDEEQDIENAYI